MSKENELDSLITTTTRITLKTKIDLDKFCAAHQCFAQDVIERAIKEYINKR